VEIQVHPANMAILECFSSESRVKMIELLGTKPMNIGELAEALGISSAIVTKHVQKMEEAGLIRTESVTGTRGRRKICHLRHKAITLRMEPPRAAGAEAKQYTVSIPIGQYIDYAVKPTCGLAAEDAIIGIVDDPRYFSSPDRVRACHLWFASGFVRYRIPNYLVGNQRIRQLTVSLEMGSEAPGYNENWPSDIAFSINGVHVGTWTCPGDFGSQRGVFTPAWWNMGTQNGLLKTLAIREDGTFLDGVRLSGVTPRQLAIGVGDDIILEIANDESAAHNGGVSLFGRGFGNYDQDIEVTVRHE
jgi:Predicted transcriptional regulator